MSWPCLLSGSFFCFVLLTYERIDESYFNRKTLEIDHFRVLSALANAPSMNYFLWFPSNTSGATPLARSKGCVKIHAFEVKRVSLLQISKLHGSKHILETQSLVAEAAPAVLKWSGQEVGGAMSSGGCG